MHKKSHLCGGSVHKERHLCGGTVHKKAICVVTL